MTYPKSWNDLQMDQIIGTILRVGVLVSALVVFGGRRFLFDALWFQAAGLSNFSWESPADLSNVPGIIRDAWAFRSRGIIQFGLLLLIATPVVRVAFSIIGFALQRDRTYIMVTMIVLALLLFSLAGAGR